MASASSAMGMRPEKPAAAYPYVTLAISFRPNWRAFSTRCRTYSNFPSMWMLLRTAMFSSVLAPRRELFLDQNLRCTLWGM